MDSLGIKTIPELVEQAIRLGLKSRQVNKADAR
jgi:hypothetical protein